MIYIMSLHHTPCATLTMQQLFNVPLHLYHSSILYQHSQIQKYQENRNQISVNITKCASSLFFINQFDVPLHLIRLYTHWEMAEGRSG